MWSMDTIEWIDIELTSFCNIQCKGCFRVISKQADKILNKEFIDLEIIKTRFQKNMFPNIKIINFCGSVDEPCTHPQFFDIIKHFAEWNCHINIATNGSLKTKEWWGKLATLLPTSHRVTWGIDGSDKLSEEYRQGSNFNKVKENFKSFIAAGGHAVWQFIVFEHNEHQLEQAKIIAKEEGFKDFKVIMSHRENVNDIKHKKVGDILELDLLKTTISCKYGNQKRIFVNHMGNVIPCCHLNSKMLEFSITNEIKDDFEKILTLNDYKNEININNVSIEHAINGPIFNSIKQSWESSPIPRCNQVCKNKERDIFIKSSL